MTESQENSDLFEAFEKFTTAKRLVEEHARSQKIISTAQKLLKENVNVDRFDYFVRVEGIYRRQSIDFDLGVAITWKHDDKETVLLYAEELANDEVVEVFVNVWTVLSEYLTTDDDVRDYLDAVDFDNRTMVGASQYMYNQDNAA